MKFKSGAQRKAVMANLKKKNLNIVTTYVPRGSGNNPEGGRRDLRYMIQEWGYIFPSREDAENYAVKHKISSKGYIVKDTSRYKK